MIRKEHQSIFQYLGISLKENDSKITIDQINYAEKLKPINHINNNKDKRSSTISYRKIVMDEQSNKI